MVADKDTRREIPITLPEGDDDTPPWYVPEGHYRFQVVATERKEGPKADYVQFSLATYYQGIVKVVEHRCTLSPRYTFSLKAMLKSLGLPHRGRVTLDLDAMLGRWLEADVVDEEYNGKLKSNVTEVYPPEGPPPQGWPDLLAEQAQGEPDSFWEERVRDTGPLDDEDLPF